MDAPSPEETLGQFWLERAEEEGGLSVRGGELSGARTRIGMKRNESNEHLRPAGALSSHAAFALRPICAPFFTCQLQFARAKSACLHSKLRAQG